MVNSLAADHILLVYEYSWAATAYMMYRIEHLAKSVPKAIIKMWKEFINVILRMTETHS